MTMKSSVSPRRSWSSCSILRPLRGRSGASEGAGPMEASGANSGAGAMPMAGASAGGKGTDHASSACCSLRRDSPAGASTPAQPAAM